MLPSILAKQLQKGMGDYIDTTFPMTNKPFQGSMKQFIADKDAVFHEPYFTVRLPFRVAEKMPTCFEAIHPQYLPYVHQEKAFLRLTGDDGRPTLIATGTGSGKTECFLYPILEYCYQHRGERGIKALIIYPMNALAADQAKRIAELIYHSPELRGNVTVGMYVGGQEKMASRMMSEHGVITDHDTMRNNAPDILMTNYKMLDYLLIRPKDVVLWRDNNPDTLKYIAVDELHTFDGAQGTDLACLLRRLKTRLYTPGGYLCCIGTSATMGSSDNSDAIRTYAAQVFGESFEQDAVITEDRLTAKEFFADSEMTEFLLPNQEQIAGLEAYLGDDDEQAYLQEAVRCWLEDAGEDIFTDESRIRLGERLMHHSMVQTMLFLMHGKYCQVDTLLDAFKHTYPKEKYPALYAGDTTIYSLLALVSFARTGTEGHLRPFLNVQVQLWMRELRRLMAKVSSTDVKYDIAHDLNKKQAECYLPIINCRDCGATGWVTRLNERGNATMVNLDAFYNLYFRADESITMLFPGLKANKVKGMIPARICPNCLHVKLGEDGSNQCEQCGSALIPVQIPSPIVTAGTKENKQYVCPCCGSHRGLSLMGLRSATEISASISQMFASKFNDDKKTLAFSDNVQDAAHRAGFFNSRTWRFGLRSAIQHYVMDGGGGESLQEFTQGFLQYWHQKLSNEDFVGFFIAPNMTWMQAYEVMKTERKLKNDYYGKKLMEDIEKRVSYEVMLEYGLGARIGRTLEKAGCSMLSFDVAAIQRLADAVQERTVNELAIMQTSEPIEFKRMVIGFLNTMRMNGAFDDRVFYAMIANDGNGYHISNERIRWMPGRQSGRNTPRFLVNVQPKGKGRAAYDVVTGRKYTDWLAYCCQEIQEALVIEDSFAAIGRIILEEAVKEKLIVALPSPVEYIVYGLNKERVYITDQVQQMCCESCGSVYSVAKDCIDLWTGAPCLRRTCEGILQQDDDISFDYYGKLYSHGDMVRINSREHTGLLARSAHEQLENDFKRTKEEHAVWDPNVLSCTPTLEMGIDIGDLSTVVLCSMPPAQSQFLQRAGRAGRKDGNALTLVIANSRPHDLYFYADPMDMIAGNVQPPKVFLRASAVLERQFVAYCMDSWVKRGVPEQAIPKNVCSILDKLEIHPVDIFPFNFLSYVQNNLSYQIRSFLQMFSDYLDDSAKVELLVFAQGNRLQESPMHLKILESFNALKKERAALSDSIKQLGILIKTVEAKPKDSSYEEEIKELKSEQAALRNVRRELNRKNVFNFLSDEGLLPNYAFPEAGVVLKAVLYRKEESDEEIQGTKKYEKKVYEYSRSASSAISEFAPLNDFYVDGRKLTINQVDLTTAQATRWRLCPNCSHVQIEEAGKNVSCCPSCGSPGWADSGQVRTMLKVQMVYSNMDYTKSLINDESDDRSSKFYCKQMLVDVDEEHDISSAYQMDNEEFPFGYEFVKKATLREINFGESDMVGEKLSVSGVEEVRKGFKVCKYCGKIQPAKGKAEHTYFCKAKNLSMLDNEPYEECLFLYREFTTEILRLLIPATTMDASTVRTESFVAAFMLGMKGYFGNVDHLRATVSEVPVSDADYRKQYLVIYDSVPGGTGYLKQLMQEKDALIKIFEKSLEVMANCSCKEDDQKDGCYHCLYAYRQIRNIGNISRLAAMRILKAILSGKANIEEIGKLDSVPVNALFDSELERRFIGALDNMGNDIRKVDVSKALVRGKEGWIIKLNDVVWEIEPQVSLDMKDGVPVSCKPDFVLWPVSQTGKKPVAIFTDGFLYHKDKVADDTLKREAIRRSGNFRVWSLSWHDVQSVFQLQDDYATNALAPGKMPLGSKMYQPMVSKEKAEEIQPDKMSAMEILVQYLILSEAERVFAVQAKAYSLSLLEPAKMTKSLDYMNWQMVLDKIISNTHFIEEQFIQGQTLFGTWIPRTENVHLRIYGGGTTYAFKAGAAAMVCAVLDDLPESRTDKYENEWNGLWQFFNVMQFLPSFIAVSVSGLKDRGYLSLPVRTVDSAKSTKHVSGKSDWNEIMELIFDDVVKEYVMCLAKSNISIPDEVGYEVIGSTNEVIATVELAWIEGEIAYLTSEQMDDKVKLEKLGWKILTGRIEEDKEIF
jgi:DEAD/DEAH box helicase domain-containing protein